MCEYVQFVPTVAVEREFRQGGQAVATALTIAENLDLSMGVEGRRMSGKVGRAGGEPYFLGCAASVTGVSRVGRGLPLGSGDPEPAPRRQGARTGLAAAAVA